jgi:rhodanese-related sulfurtransferase
MVQAISPKDAAALIQRGEVEVIDVREPHEWLTGHIPGARHVPLAKFRQNPSAHLSHEHVVFVCAAGVRSQLAAQLAKSTGSLTRALNLTGGTRAWAKDGFALEVPAVRAAS